MMLRLRPDIEVVFLTSQEIDCAGHQMKFIEHGAEDKKAFRFAFDKRLLQDKGRWFWHSYFENGIKWVIGIDPIPMALCTGIQERQPDGTYSTVSRFS